MHSNIRAIKVISVLRYEVAQFHERTECVGRTARIYLSGS